MIPYSLYLGDETVAIFLLHGVIRKQNYLLRNYTRKHLLLDEFAEFLKDLQANGTPVSMPELVVASLSGEALPSRSFIITFDDGFENNYSIAAPVLDELGIPATFYITTGFVESNSSSWIDMIEYAFEQRQRFVLDLPLVESNGAFSTYEQKTQLLDQIRRHVKSRQEIDPYKFAHKIWEQLSIAEMTPDPELDQKMSWQQVQQLSRDELFTIGGHSHTHRILEFLDTPELENEISMSINKLQSNLEISIEHYSYPEGMENCYSDRVIGLLQQHGIICAPSAVHGVNHANDDLFHLKRIMVT